MADHGITSLRARPVAHDAAAGWVTLTPGDTSQPLHERVTAAIAHQIELGTLRPGSLLPPELELARRFGVSRHTVRAGIAGLVRAGMLERHRGRGTYVRRPRIQQSLARFYSLAQEMRTQGKHLETQVLARGGLTARHELAQPACRALSLDDPAAIGYLRRLRLVDGTPLLLETIAFPAALCPVLLEAPPPGASAPDDPAAAPFYDTLAERVGLVVSRAHETLRPVAVGRAEARWLGVPPGTPVFAVERTSFAGDRAVELRRTLVRGDRVSYAVDLLNPVDEGEHG